MYLCNDKWEIEIDVIITRDLSGIGAVPWQAVAQRLSSS